MHHTKTWIYLASNLSQHTEDLHTSRVWYPERETDTERDTHSGGFTIGRGLGVHKEVGYIRRPGIHEGRINKESGSGLHTERVRSAHRGSVHTEGGEPRGSGQVLSAHSRR